MPSALVVVALALAPVVAGAAPPDRSVATSPGDTRVVGGTPVPRGAWPDVVAVLGRDFSCTGTLIAPDVVLTAGHCIEPDGPIEVIADTVNLGLPGTGDRIPVKWARAYPGWEQRYDIGVVVLARAARGAPRAIAAACDTRAGLVPRAQLHLVGFGAATARGDDLNTALREVDLPVIDPTCTMDAACEAAIAPHGEFIAGGNGIDACFGDSGGPIYLPTAEGPALVGVVSRGLAVPGLPCQHGGIYVRADKVVAWVQRVTGVRLSRTHCEGPADGVAGVDAEDGGCSAASGAGESACVLILLAIATATCRRRARPDLS